MAKNAARRLVALLLLLSLHLAAAAQSVLPRPDLGLMEAGNNLSAVAVQPDGKVVVGGSFTVVNGQARRGIARFNTDGTLDASWNPALDLNGVITALAIGDGVVYVAGTFTSIGGQPRAGLAALDIVTGHPTSWNARVFDGVVSTMAVSGNLVYVGGSFQRIGAGVGAFRNRIAALAADTGIATAWNPDANNGVFSIAISGGTVYIGGEFGVLNEVFEDPVLPASRRGIAALDATTGLATAWDPAAGTPVTVNALAVSGGTVYAGGRFTALGGQPRSNIAALDATTGLANSWNPNADGDVKTLALENGKVYAGGPFTMIGGLARAGAAALDPAGNGAADAAWDPASNAPVQQLAVAPGGVYAIGAFNRIGGRDAMGLARLNAGTGGHAEGAAAAVGAAGAVRALARLADGRLVVGGAFTWVAKAGVRRNNLLRLNADDTLDPSWDPDVEGTVHALAVSGTTVYAGGDFSAIGGLARNNAGAVNATGGVTAWHPDADDVVHSLAVAHGVVYAGGDFTSIGGAMRSRIAALALDASGSGAAISAWDPGADGRVSALAVSGSLLYAGGDFARIAESDRNHLAALDAEGAATEWNPNPDFPVRALAVAAGVVYAAGAVRSGAAAAGIARIDEATGTLTQWPDAAGSAVEALAVARNRLYAGGAFAAIGAAPRASGLAALNASSATTAPWNPAPDLFVHALLSAGSGVYVGGSFASIGGQPRAGLARLTGAGAVRGDLSGDARSDILWRHLGAGGTGQNYLYPMNGKTIGPGEGFVRTVSDLAWKVAGIGDFNGDGRADVLWRHSVTGQNYLYLMNGTAISGEGYLRSVVQPWQVAGVGDFDGDGRDDILWRHGSTGENYLYPMDGLSIRAGEGFLRRVADTAWRVAGVADLDGDGKADILWRHSASGQNYVYPMDGKAIKATEGYVRTVDIAWEVQGLGDFDGDGKADIAWRLPATGENYFYLMNGAVIRGEGYVRTVPGPWRIEGMGDYDGDGKADLFWRNPSTGENYLFPMNGTAIMPTEGYVRSVPAGNWTAVGGVP